MSNALLKSALKLSKAQRILLVERIWDSVAEEDAEPRLSKAQEAELDRRLKRLAKTGPRGESWEVVKARVRKRA